jgi:flagellar hook-basal body complex protein FliE
MAIQIGSIGAQPPSVQALPPSAADAIADPLMNAAELSAGQSPIAFQTVLAEAVQRVEGYHASASASIGQFLEGGDVELHQVALAVQKSETAFEFLVEVRNKVVQAYQEIMRMPV